MFGIAVCSVNWNQPVSDLENGHVQGLGAILGAGVCVESQGVNTIDPADADRSEGGASIVEKQRNTCMAATT